MYVARETYNDAIADKHFYKNIKDSSDRGEIYITPYNETTLSKQPIIASLVQDWEIVELGYYKRITPTNNTTERISEVELNDVIARRIGQIPEVEKIFIIEENGAKKIFTIINSNDFRVKKLVYETEGYIIDHFDNERCDFHIIWREGKDLNSIIRFTENPIYNKD